MFKIDCSAVLQEGTDFAFDHLSDDIGPSDVLTIHYPDQEVLVHEGDEEFAEEVRDTIETRVIEKLQDMKREAKAGYSVGYDADLLRTEISNTKHITITEESSSA